MRGSLYTQELIDEYLKKGYWDLTKRADVIDRNGREVPDKEALVDSKTRLTWSEVSQRSDRLALGLLAEGYKKDDVLLVQLPNWVELYLLLVACEKVGIILATAQPTFRHAELLPVLKHVEAKAIVIPYEFRSFNYFEMAKEMQKEVPALKDIIIVGDKIPEGALSFEELEKGDVEGKFPPDYLRQIRPDPFEVVKIATTSGSTGTPKCIEFAIANRMASGRNMAKFWEMGPDDIVGVFYNIIGGGASIISPFASPIVRAKVVLVDRFDPQLACELIEKEKITIAAIVPALMARLLDYPDLDKYDFSSLRLIHNSTSLLPYELGIRAEKALGARYVQTYGTMDAGSPIATFSINDPPEVRVGTVGRPYFEGTFKMVDENGQELPEGEIGEVAYRGPCCASGYYKGEDLNKEFWRDGWYFTGNQGKFDEHGNVIILGRKRETIIRGGQNIFPIEIENLLMQHPKVSDVSVVRMPDRVMGEKACAYVVPRRDQVITFEEMVSFLKDKKLAPFKLPERLEILDALPLVPAAQKVDKIKLEKDIARKLELESEQE
jgi:non-ribosomal peptide synthetase component E (peptide arylation enzyme)